MTLTSGPPSARRGPQLRRAVPAGLCPLRERGPASSGLETVAGGHQARDL